MTEAISSEQERQLAQQHDELFAPHRAALRTQLFPESTLVNTSTHHAVNCWTADSRVLKPLLDALPFGVILRADHYANFRDHALNLIPDLARKQLLFWQLDRPLTLGEPIQALTLAEEEANLWHDHVVPNEFEYQQALVGGERLRFLTCFHLDYTRIRITLAGVRLRSTPEPFGQTSYAFVQCDDREYTYVWTEQRWDVSIDSNDPRTVNPEIFTVPAPLRPSDNLGVPIALLATPDTPLPPSTPSDPVSSGWEGPLRPWTPNFAPSECWCKQEVCDCNYRPDTPPTPENIVLWTPRAKYLPYQG